jgi:hypothetical protein
MSEFEKTKRRISHEARVIIAHTQKRISGQFGAGLSCSQFGSQFYFIDRFLAVVLGVEVRTWQPL